MLIHHRVVKVKQSLQISKIIYAHYLGNLSTLSANMSQHV